MGKSPLDYLEDDEYSVFIGILIFVSVMAFTLGLELTFGVWMATQIELEKSTL